MSLDEFNPYKANVSMQRLIMGKYFFPFFSENINKYRNKLPILKSIEEDLIEDMRLFLIDNLWLKDDNSKLKITVIENTSFQRAMELFGNPKQKTFAENEQGQKEQHLIWLIEEDKELSAKYTLIDRVWQLQDYSLNEK